MSLPILAELNPNLPVVIGYGAIIGCVVYCYLYEYILRHFEITFPFLWQGSIATMVLLVSRIAWSSFVMAETNLADILTSPSPEQNAVSYQIFIVLFFVGVALVIASLLKTILRWVKYGLTQEHPARIWVWLRAAEVVAVVVTSIINIIQCNAMVGEDGLLALFL